MRPNALSLLFRAVSLSPAMAQLVINVHDIDEIGRDFTFPLTRAWLEGALAGTEVRPDLEAPEGELDLHVQRQGADIVLHGRLRGAIVTECARCLGDARIPVDTAVGSLLTARGEAYRPEPDEHELTPEELDREFFTGERIVLDDMVREHLLLEVPIKPLCQEACPGIPVPSHVAGPADLAAPVAEASEGGVDPRLAPLLKLVGKLEPSEPDPTVSATTEPDPSEPDPKE